MVDYGDMGSEISCTWLTWITSVRFEREIATEQGGTNRRTTTLHSIDRWILSSDDDGAGDEDDDW